jgi:glycosyltransferase involved in cell wall biosynthesis
MREFGADLVNCHAKLIAPAVIAAANQAEIPCVFTMHAGISPQVTSLPAKLKNGPGRRFTIITVSRRNFETLERLNFPEDDLYYVPSGVSPLSATSPEDHIPPDQPNLVFLGGLIRMKGADIALLALAELRRRRGHDCPMLEIYGEEDGEGQFFREMVTALNVSDIVKFRGFQVGALERCPSSDILVVSSRKETGPLTVLEAMSRGMPIVASDVGEVAEMLPDQRYGHIVAVNSILALADGIESLIADIRGGRFNPQILIDRYQSFYTIEKMAERVETIYEQVLLKGCKLHLAALNRNIRGEIVPLE